VEIPFLKERKDKKVARLKQLIDFGDHFAAEMMTLVNQLKAEQGDFMASSWEIQQLYKLPKDSEI